MLSFLHLTPIGPSGLPLFPVLVVCVPVPLILFPGLWPAAHTGLQRTAVQAVQSGVLLNWRGFLAHVCRGGSSRPACHRLGFGLYVHRLFFPTWFVLRRMFCRCDACLLCADWLARCSCRVDVVPCPAVSLQRFGSSKRSSGSSPKLCSRTR